MDDQLDKDIKNRIREVFDNYDDPSADEGWLQLREKFPEEKAKRRAVAWIWWSAAALLLLFLGVGLWEFEKMDAPAKLTGIKKHSPVSHQNGAAQKGAPGITNDKQASIVKNENKTVSGGIAENNAPGNTNKQPSIVKNESKTVSGGIAKNGVHYVKPANNYPVNGGNSLKLSPVVSDTSNKTAHAVKRKDSVMNNIARPPVNQFASTVQTNTNKQASELNKPAAIKPAADNPDKNTSVVNKPVSHTKSIESMFAEDHQSANKKVDGEKKVYFGVYAATYFNYAKGSGNQPNLGAGITSEITLSKNLKLVTGVTISQNSLAFNNSTPVAGSQNSSFSAASSGIAAGAAPGANLIPMAGFSIGEVNTASTPTYRNYSASLVGLDIPLNLKYEFNPKKTDFYVLAGFSSGTFINETYTYQYNYPALPSPNLQQLKNETAHSSFNSFYVGKMLNFAFGVGYPLGKNRIVLEPFLKYPLEGLGSQDIKFGAGGINLKFNFTTNKK